MKLSEETYEKIIKLYQEQKYTQKKIAEMCNCSVDSVSRCLIKNGLKEEKLSKKLLNIYDSVVEDFINGEYCKDIAKKYQIDEHSVYKILDKAGLKRKTGYKTKCNENYFEIIDNANKAYLLGFITADGAVVNNILSIEVNKTDVDVLNFAKSQINPEATLTPSRNCLRVCFSAKKLGQDLKKYGVIQNKSKILKKVPVELIPNELLPFYFRGLIDGDGCIHKDGKISIYSGSYDFIKDVQNILCEKAGLKKLKIYNGTTYFISWGSKEDKEKLFNYLYSNLDDSFYYKRKYERLFQNINISNDIIHDNTEITN